METTPRSRPPEDLTGDPLLAQAPRVEYRGAQRPALGGIPLLVKLGQGGMGAVYYGIQPSLDAEVAVKVLPLHLVSQNPEIAKRFIREAQIAASINCPNLISVRDLGQDGGYFYQVMEYVHGVSAGGYLRHVIAKTGRRGLPEPEALNICIAAAKGLAAAHARNIIHRDIKPDNILIPKAWGKAQLLFSDAKVADLGLARTERAEAATEVYVPQAEGHEGSSLTGAGQAMGTLGYMPPEQIDDARSAGKPADVFALGATLYALLAGHAPFEGDTSMERTLETALGRRKPLLQLRPDVSAATAALVDRCLSKEPAQRYPDGVALLTALQNCRAGVSRLSSPAVPAAGAAPSSVEPKPGSTLPAAGPASAQPTAASALAPTSQTRCARCGRELQANEMTIQHGQVVCWGCMDSPARGESRPSDNVAVQQLLQWAKLGAALVVLVAGSVYLYTHLRPKRDFIVTGTAGFREMVVEAIEQHALWRTYFGAKAASSEKRPMFHFDVDMKRSYGVSGRHGTDATIGLTFCITDLRSQKILYKGSFEEGAAGAFSLEFCYEKAMKAAAPKLATTAAIVALSGGAQFRSEVLEAAANRGTYYPAPVLEALERIAPADKAAQACLDSLRGVEPGQAAPPVADPSAPGPATVAPAPTKEPATRYGKFMRDALVRVATKDWRSARYGFENALREKPGDSEALKGLKQALYECAMEDGRRHAKYEGGYSLPQAEEAFRRALTEKPDDPDATKALQDTMTAQRDKRYADAMRDGRRHLRDNSRYSRSRAEEAFQRALQEKPGDVEATQGLEQLLAASPAEERYSRAVADGRTALAGKKWTEAEGAFKRALLAKPDDPEATRGIQYTLYERAMEEGRRALEKKSAPDAQAAFSRALQARPNDAEAKQGLQQTLAGLPADTRYANAMKEGQRALEEKKWEVAEAALNAALQAKPDDPAATQGLSQARTANLKATTTAAASKVRAAAETLKRTASKSGKDEVRRLEGIVQTQQRALQTAKFSFEKRAAEKKLADAQDKLTAALRETDNARQTIADAKKEFSELAEKCKVETQAVSECQAAFAAALREVPAPEADRMCSMAENFIGAKEPGKAKELLRKVLAEYPDSAAADKARKMLEGMK